MAEPVEDGEREGGGLAGAGLGGGEDIAAGEDQRDGFGLDGGRGGVPLFGDGLEQVGRQAERVEGQGVSCVPDCGHGRRRRAKCELFGLSGAGRRPADFVVTRTSIPNSTMRTRGRGPGAQES